MKLYIEIDSNGQIVNHPAFENNLLEVFGKIPDNWVPFIRVEKPMPKVYEILNSDKSTYQKVNGTWTDVWDLRDMTLEEKLKKQQIVKNNFNNRPQASNWASWIFNEEICAYEPPIPKPDEIPGKIIFWCGAENNWKEAPPYPIDNNNYQFDFFAWKWVIQ